MILTGVKRDSSLVVIQRCDAIYRGPLIPVVNLKVWTIARAEDQSGLHPAITGTLRRGVGLQPHHRPQPCQAFQVTNVAKSPR